MIVIWIIGGIVLLILVINVYQILDPRFGGKPERKQIEKLAKHSVYEKGRFKNSNDVPTILPKSYGKVLRQQFKKNPERVPEIAIPSVKPVLSDITAANTSFIWLGHSTVLIRIDSVTILIDPVFSKRASPFSFIGPKSFEYTNPVTPEDFPFPDIILISHDHYDHLDYRTIKKYYRSVKEFYVPLGIKSHLVRWGIAGENITEFDWWEGKLYNEKVEFIAAPAQHFSGRRGQNNSTLWCSWIMKADDNAIFFSGDSGYSPHFAEIGDKYGPFDLVFMECGAYGMYWPYIHMVPEQSVQAGIDVKAKTVVPIHWGKFNLSFHPWKEPIERFTKEAEKVKLNISVPIPGYVMVIPVLCSDNDWWRILD